MTDAAPAENPLALLRRARRDTQARIAELSRTLADIVDATDSANVDDEHDPEGATIAFERAQVQSVLDQERLQLDALDAAADRVESGTFGVCAGCGGAIAIDRLVVLPATELCVKCADAAARR